MTSMDEDMAETVARMKKAVQASGLSQAAFAIALGTSGPRLSSYIAGKVAPSAPTLLRALRIGNSLSGAAASGWLTAPAAAAAAAKALTSADELWAFKLLLQGRDHLRQLLANRPELAGAWEAAPRSTSSERWDALMAALAAHEFESAGRPAPAWTARPPLPEPWILASPRLTEYEIRERTPQWLADRGIYANERDLVTL
jgi:transcriptional regulator with XRE-family HTH domain